MLTIIIPTFNEAEMIKDSVFKVRDFLQRNEILSEILVVDNGSTDGTVEICKEISKTNDWFRVFDLPEKGPGNAFVKGVRESLGENVLSLDADLSSNLDFILDASRVLENSPIVIGSKSMGTQRRTLFRIFGSYCYISMAQLLFDLSITDYSIGCKAFRKSFIEPLLPHLDSWTGYVFEICLFCKVNKVTIIEVGVDCEDNYESRFSLSHEAYYRFGHLFSVWKKMKSKNFWIRVV